MRSQQSRRSFLKDLSLLGILAGAGPELMAFGNNQKIIMTVKGPIDAESLGFTLSHEHILVDFIGADKTGYDRWNRQEVIKKVLPYLKEIKLLGCKSVFDCTPAFLGRDPLLLKQLADQTSLNVVTNTGLYGARQNKFIPEYAFAESADQLAARWVDEWKNGIENSGIKPGFIKIGIDPGHLSAMHEKLVRAAARTHLKSGLTIASHTGTALGAFDEIDVLKDEGVLPDAFIWVHAQVEQDLELHVKAAKMGAWVSLDNVNDKDIDHYIAMISNLRASKCLQKLLVSHDAGWYTPGEPNGGDFRGYTDVFKLLIPKLVKHKFSDQEIHQIFVINPAEAFTINMRRI